MEITLALLCEAANLTDDGRLNVLGAFDRLTTRTIPTEPTPLTLVVRTSTSPAEQDSLWDVIIRLLDEDGDIVSTVEALYTPNESDSSGSPNVETTVLRLPGIVFDDPGQYAIHVLFNGDEKARVPFELVVTDPKSEDINGDGD